MTYLSLEFKLSVPEKDKEKLLEPRNRVRSRLVPIEVGGTVHE